VNTAILYLHGVGQKVRTDEWYVALAKGLADVGVEVPPIDSSGIICPDYVDLLKMETHPKCDEPRKSERADLSGSQRLSVVAAYKRRQTQLTRHLGGLSNLSVSLPLGQGVDPAKLPLPADLKDARRYLESSNLRNAVLQRILSRLGSTRDVVIVGHSLGSVVAIDLLNYLPPKLRVRGLVTLGSPAGAVGFHRSDMGRLLRTFPYTQVETWINFLAPNDVVTRGMGLTTLFPAAHDVRIESAPIRSHAVTGYLQHPAVAEVLAELLAEPAVVSMTVEDEETSLELSLDREEIQMIDSLLFARRVGGVIRNEARRSRYEHAVQEVSIDTGTNLIDLRKTRQRPVPPELVSLLKGESPSQSFAESLIKKQLEFVVVAATNNLVAPYDINVQREAERTVRHVWAEDFGYSMDDGNKIVAALNSATAAFRSTPWNRVAIGAVGLGLLAAGPLGLMFAAPVGVAGGAAIVGSLAAFGPGGMVGGLALAGGMVGAGASIIGASVMASSEVSPDMLRTQLIRLMTVTKAAVDLGLVSDGGSLWLLVNDLHSKESNRLWMLESLSDKDAPSLKEIRAKIKILEQTLAWLVEERLSIALE
jgi:pimeloyl-ACP methyl ester carboxylesterase